MPRRIQHRYRDPLELVWLQCARELGIEVVRSNEVYASFDGKRTLTLSSAEHFDADDSLAQLIFHELCHALVAGERGRGRADWGMENVDERDVLQEHACHRLQAALAGRHGLREFFAVTTDWRSYWDALPLDPLAPGADPAIPLAREAYVRARRGPWAAAIEQALARTREVAELVRGLGTGLESDSLWLRTRALHASGFALGDRPEQRCGDCAFGFEQGGVLRCRKSAIEPPRKHARVSADAQACERFEARFDENTCGECGACCREGFDRVDVRARDLVRKRHPELVKVDGFGAHLPRPGGRCVALTGGEQANSPYRCRVYAERPSACADFAMGGDACLTARRRVGLSA
ncbi:MAG: YkgJ family cysteine cluster protein [Myxococcales bacterium]